RSRPCRHGAKMATSVPKALARWRRRGWRRGLALVGRARFGAPARRPSGQRRSRGRLRPPGDNGIEGLGVRVPERSWSLAAQFLLGRLHRGDGVGRLTLRLRELLDVVLERCDLLPQPFHLL